MFINKNYWYGNDNYYKKLPRFNNLFDPGKLIWSEESVK